MDTQDFLPVILGGDTGAYALALEFYEAYGCRSTFVANAPADIVTYSHFADVERVPARASDEEILAVLDGIAAINRDKTLILLTNTDGKAAFAARHRERLGDRYVIPFPSLEAMAAVSEKDAFTAACQAVGAKTPPTVVVDLSDSAVPDIPFDFPVVAKTASGRLYDLVAFEGKKKIYFIDSAEELAQLWETLRQAGYTGKFLVQEQIPGPDSQMLSLTLYVDSHGTVTMQAGARVLLEDHTPQMVGNPVAMITEEFPHLWDQAAQILRNADYHGFANFDLKIDPRDDSVYFFEVNPRIGRNSYYVVGAGVNPMQIMVEDLVFHKKLAPVTASEETLYSLVPVGVITKYLDDDQLKQRVLALVSDKKVVSPLEQDHEPSRRRRLIVALQKQNYRRKFAKYFPKTIEGNDS